MLELLVFGIIEAEFPAEPVYILFAPCEELPTGLDVELLGLRLQCSRRIMVRVHTD